MELEDTPVLIAGGASGLGKATAELLIRSGSRVAILDRNEELVNATAEEIGATGYVVDVTDEESVTAAMQDHQSRFGAARILLNSAGITDINDIVGDDGSPYPLENFRRVIDINLVGTFNCLRLFAARLAASDIADTDRGLVINVSSIAGIDGADHRAAYVSSKAAVAGLTISAARNLARHRIRVMTIAPGLFETPLVSDDVEARIRWASDVVPHPSRMGDAEEFADLAKFICQTPYLNGEVIRLDGAARV